MKKEFEFTTPLSKTSNWAGQIRIKGQYWMDNGSLMCDIEILEHTIYQTPHLSDWRYIPNTFWTWLENGSDRIGEIAYEHCKVLIEADATDITTDLQQDAHITDLKTQNKLS